MGCCDKCKEQKAARVGMNWPNKRCWDRKSWNALTVDEPSFIVSVEGAPATLYYLMGDKAPDASRIGDTTVEQGRAGVGFLRCPGKWWLYWDGAAGKECFKTIPVTDAPSALVVALLGGLVPTAPGNLPSLKTASLPVLAANTPTQMAGFPVTPGMTVRVTADPRNLDYLLVAGSASCCEDAKGATLIAPGDSRPYLVTDFSGLWFASPDAAAVARFETENPTVPACT